MTITNDNSKCFEEYLTENHKLNRTKDNAMIARIQKSVTDFDPLQDSEPDTTILVVNKQPTNKKRGRPAK